MRIIIAAIAILLGALALLVGIGQRTFWAPPEIATATIATGLKDAPLTVIEPGVADVHEGPVDITIDAGGEFVAALGRSADVDAWVGKAAHNTVTSVDAKESVVNAEHTDGDAKVPNPASSDLWVGSETAQGHLVHRWTQPADGNWSLLLASDGTKPAPTNITVSWTNDAGTPFSIPLIIVGSLLIVFGVATAIVAGRGRGGDGTRARTANGTPPAAGAGTGGATAVTDRGEGSTSRVADAGRHGSGTARVADAGRHGSGTARVADAHGNPWRTTTLRTAALTAAAALVLAPAGPAMASTAPPSSPASGSSASPAPAEGTPAPTDAADDQLYPVVLPEQLNRILAHVSSTVSKADADKNAKLLKGRVGGTALQLRKENYQQRADGMKVAAPAEVAPEPVLSAAVTTTVQWPRTLMVVTKAKKAKVPQVLVLRQDDARANYKLVSSVSMLPGSEFPGIAVGDTSIRTLPKDAGSLSAQPLNAAKDLAAYLSDPKSKKKSAFASSVFIKATHKGQAEAVKNNKDARITYKRNVDEKSIQVLSTPNGGAMVSAQLTSRMSAVPKEEGGTVKLDEPTSKLAGAKSTKKGVDITYSEPVVFYIPADGSKDKISLVAGDVVLDSAKLRK